MHRRKAFLLHSSNSIILGGLQHLELKCENSGKFAKAKNAKNSSTLSKEYLLIGCKQFGTKVQFQFRTKVQFSPSKTKIHPQLYLR